MSQQLIETLAKLLKLHKSLNRLAKDKTEMIKKNEITSLQSLLTEEQAHIKAIRFFESNSKKIVVNIMEQHGVKAQVFNLTTCMQYVNQDEKELIKDIQSALIKEVEELKSQNDLNQQLIEQSLQFVNLSLDLLIPDTDSYNYGRQDQADDYESTGRSFFDSKA